MSLIARDIFYSEEDRGYIADIPDLETYWAFGETAEQALAEVAKYETNGRGVPRRL